MKTGLVKVDVQALISQGLEKGAGIDVMERLFVMAKDMKATQAREAYFEALAAFQKDTPKIIKTKEVRNKEKILKYMYAPLDEIVAQVKDNLHKHGFSYALKTKQDDAKYDAAGKLVKYGTMTVSCEAHHVAGHTETTDMTVPVGSDYMTAQQQVGAALTFAKRYAFCDAFGLMTGDEDTDAVDTDAPADTKPATAQAAQPFKKAEDAPPFPKEEYKPSETYNITLKSCKDLLVKMTDGLTTDGKNLAFKDTCKSVFGEKKYYKPLDKFTLAELEKLYGHLMAGK